ncbi:MAG: bifunctional adenosylcobinamide kinase/adenosylcobinamide-phosphate guanylyltransferase [Gammaproteobacteria bacterium]|nr:bifunctional adenosylcobinamide kinase/adenosylcobinamide-phosphate guanylyltransferase [Gammaproteobacteria bacterium]
MKTLVLGGTRSGKSALAEQLAAQTQQPVTYIATATVQDHEMQQRIQQHQQRRPTHWLLIEAPLHLASALQQADAEGHTLLVDCLSIWISNLLCAENPTQLQAEIDNLLTSVPQLQSQLILVSNESNMGITPLGKLSRDYCDHIGLLHQQLATRCDSVILTVAGLPHYLKGAASL